MNGDSGGGFFNSAGELVGITKAATLGTDIAGGTTFTRLDNPQVLAWIQSVTALPPACPSDITGDRVVDDSDFVGFLRGYNILDCADPTMPQGCLADLNADSVVDDADFVLFIVAYEQVLCP